MAQNINGVINEAQATVTIANKVGSDFTGSNGGSNRTLTLDEPVIAEVIGITIQGVTLHEGVGKDFTRSGNVITILGGLWDSDNVRVAYMV